MARRNRAERAIEEYVPLEDSIWIAGIWRITESGRTELVEEFGRYDLSIEAHLSINGDPRRFELTDDSTYVGVRML